MHETTGCDGITEKQCKTGDESCEISFYLHHFHTQGAFMSSCILELSRERLRAALLSAIGNEFTTALLL
jgi:hypothetical protein